MRELARTYAEGLAKYGLDNWTKGMPILDTINHVQTHINKFLLGDRSEPHIAHAMWGLAAVIHFTSECGCHILHRELHVKDQSYLNWNKIPEIK